MTIEVALLKFCYVDIATQKEAELLLHHYEQAIEAAVDSASRHPLGTLHRSSAITAGRSLCILNERGRTMATAALLDFLQALNKDSSKR